MFNRLLRSVAQRPKVRTPVTRRLRIGSRSCALGFISPVSSKADEPPSGLTDTDRKAWFSRRADALRDQPLPRLSDAARDTMRHGAGTFDRRSDRDQG